MITITQDNIIINNILLQDDSIFPTNAMFTIKLLDDHYKYDYLKLVCVNPTVKDLPPTDTNSEEIWKRRIDENTITYSILSTSTKEFMGYCQYKNLSTKKPDIGIEILPQFQRRGLGYAVCKTLIDAFFNKTSCSKMYYKVERRNAPSIALIEKLGGICEDINHTYSQILSMLYTLTTEEIIEQARNTPAFIAALEKYSVELSAKEYPTDVLIYRIDRDIPNS